jgi:hypothetical protein
MITRIPRKQVQAAHHEQQQDCEQFPVEDEDRSFDEMHFAVVMVQLRYLVSRADEKRAERINRDLTEQCKYLSRKHGLGA